MRSVPVNDDDENNDANDRTLCRPQHHPFVYDVELILGGRLTNVDRCDLQYTTAFDEGMTGEARQPRKRKQSQILEKSDAVASGTAKGKKKPVTKKTKASAGTATTDAKKRSTTSGGTVVTKSIKKQKIAQFTEVATASIIAAATNSNGTDPFERHRRELERCFVRLEKTDVYRFFTDEVPLEFQENYDGAPIATIDPVNDGIATTTVGNQQSQEGTVAAPSTIALLNGKSKGTTQLCFNEGKEATINHAAEATER